MKESYCKKGMNFKTFFQKAINILRDKVARLNTEKLKNFFTF